MLVAGGQRKMEDLCFDAFVLFRMKEKSLNSADDKLHLNFLRSKRNTKK